MGLPWHTTSVKVLSIVASSIQSAKISPINEGTIVLHVSCIIGEYIDLHGRKMAFIVTPSIYVQEKKFLPKLLISVKEK